MKKSGASRKEQEAIAALLSSPSITAAAGKLGISELTLRRWLEEPAFAKAYRQARAQIVEHAIGVLQQTTSRAVTTLFEALGCDSPATRVRAASVLLERSLKAVELSEIMSRLDALEARQKEPRHA